MVNSFLKGHGSVFHTYGTTDQNSSDHAKIDTHFFLGFDKCDGLDYICVATLFGIRALFPSTALATASAGSVEYKFFVLQQV